MKIADKPKLKLWEVEHLDPDGLLWADRLWDLELGQYRVLDALQGNLSGYNLDDGRVIDPDGGLAVTVQQSSTQSKLFGINVNWSAVFASLKLNGDLTMCGDILPDADGTRDIGAPGNDFDEGYFTTLYLNGVDITTTFGAADALDDLTDVTLTSPINDNFFKYDGALWRNITPTAAKSALAYILHQLNDVTISGPANKELLQHNGSEWVNRTFEEADVMSLGTDQTVTGTKTVTGRIDTSDGELLIKVMAGDPSVLVEKEVWLNTTHCELRMGVSGA